MWIDICETLAKFIIELITVHRDKGKIWQIKKSIVYQFVR